MEATERGTTSPPQVSRQITAVANNESRQKILKMALEAFKAGEYDFRAENSSKAWATAYDFPAVASGAVKKGEPPHNRSTGMQGFVFNTRRPLFQDPRVRQALAYVFDFDWSNRTLFYGQYTLDRSLIRRP